MPFVSKGAEDELDSIRRSIPAGAGKIWTVLQLLFPEFVA